MRGLGVLFAALVVGSLGLCVAEDASELLKAALDIKDWVVKHRRELHKIPELQYNLTKTSKYVEGVLSELGITYESGVAISGIVANIGSGTPVVALRADMDGLPITEPKTLPYASQHDGQMHACGHDAHTAMLLGAAKLLKEREKTLQGTVRLIFQPAEEGGAGGKKMVEEGAVDGASAIFGVHVSPELDVGKIESRPGTIMAATNHFKLVVTGFGGHGAFPQESIDPWPTVANLILSYQTLVSRETDPLDSNVVSVGVVKGGDAFNAIPDTVVIEGTMRSLSPEGISKLEERAEVITKGISAAFRCETKLTYESHYPSTVNDEGAYNFAMETAKRLFGDENVQERDPVMGGEDFAFYGKELPAAFAFIGSKDKSASSIAPLHNPLFTIDEDVLPNGAAYHATMAISFLEEHSSDGAKEEL